MKFSHTTGMGQSAMMNGCLAASGDDRQMLVLGYQGTLQPEPDLCGVGGSGPAASGGFVSGGSPPQMEMLIEPLVAEGLLGLERRIPSKQRVFGEELIPLNALIEMLRERLRGILTLAVAAVLETADYTTTLVEHDLRRKFPRLISLLHEAVSDWVVATGVFHERLQRDRPRLAAWMGIADLPPVESVSGTTSDSHTGGQVVLRVVFKGGRCVYYKPRSISGEWLWHRLLEIVAEVEPSLRLPVGRVLEGSIPARYGWAESVLSRDNARGGIEGIASGLKYWHAAGAMLCLAHHVSLTDLHLGNVIATPNGPVVTDAECLGTPRGINDQARGNFRQDSEFGALGSLLDTGLLPRGEGSTMPDVSGLFGSAAAVPGFGLPQWVCRADGRYGLTMAAAALLDQGNAPRRTSALAVMPQILEGYREAAGVLLQCRRALISSGSPWRAMLERVHAPRFVLRDTLSYSILLSRSLAPVDLSSGYGCRNRLRSALLRDGSVFPKALLRTELQALLHLHVPRLVALPGARTLASSSGRSLANNFLACTAAEEVIRRMEELSEERLEAVHVPMLLLAMLDKGDFSRSG